MKREQVLPQVMADMAQRIANGATQYGEPLTTNNSRDALQDAYEEALDLAMYLKQAIMERKQAASDWAASEKARLDLEEWPGPDWSQAPEWAMWWAMDQNEAAHWFDGIVAANVLCAPSGDGFWFNGERELAASNFNYTGHWRDSLRKRPEEVK